MMTLKLGMQHWVLEYYQLNSNDDPGLILTFYGKVKGLCALRAKNGPLCRFIISLFCTLYYADYKL